VIVAKLSHVVGAQEAVMLGAAFICLEGTCSGRMQGVGGGDRGRTPVAMCSQWKFNWSGLFQPFYTSLSVSTLLHFTVCFNPYTSLSSTFLGKEGGHGRFYTLTANTPPPPSSTRPA